MSQASFRVIHGNRLEALAARLAEEIRHARNGNPLQPVSIIVPHPDMARWLRLWLAERQGVCANVDFPLPASYARRILAGLTEAPAGEFPYERMALTWRLFRLLGDRNVAQGWAALGDYLAEDNDAQHRYSLAARLAALFERYLVYRGDWLSVWERGARLGLGEAETGLAKLWQTMVEEIGQKHDAALLQRFLQQGGPSVRDERVLVFGAGHLAPAYLQLLTVLSAHCPVVMFLPSPCEHYWGDLVSRRELLRLRARWRASEMAERGDYYEVGHPLLSGWGRLGRDFLDRLHAIDAVQEEDVYLAPSIASCLGRIQASVLTLDATICDSAPAEGDESLSIHACHSRLREVEVLHDCLLAHCQSDPTLRPRDIVVMVPHLTDYAAPITAVFGSAASARHLPFRIADQTGAGPAPLLTAFLQLLDLPNSRFALSEVMGWLTLPALAAGAGLEPAQLKFLKPWLIASGVRFGLDREQRHAQGSGDYEQNTWRFGLDRLLIGYARGEHPLPWQGVVGVTEVEGIEVLALGRLCAWLDRLAELRGELQRARSVDAWRDFAERVLRDFLIVPADEHEGRSALSDIRIALAQIDDAANAAACAAPIPCAVWRNALQAQLAKLDKVAAFPADGVTFCTLHPLRNIPFRVVALLGLNDGEFPRHEARAGFDLMSKHPRAGDRNARDDDRGLFLDALLAARDALHLSFVGFGERQGEELPPAAVLGELLQFLAEQCYEGDRDSAGVALLRKHALQPFSAAYFDGSAPRSFADEWLPAARASVEARRAPPEFAATIGTMAAPNAVDLTRLLNYFKAPAREILRDRLGIRLDDAGDRSSDEDSFDLDGLQRHQLKDLLLRRTLATGGAQVDAVPDWLRGMGILPYGPRGDQEYRAEAAAIHDLATRLAAYAAAPLPPQVLRLQLGGFDLSATLGGLTDFGLLRYRVGKCRAADLLDLWIHHLMLASAEWPGSGPQRLLLCIEAQDVMAFGLTPLAPVPARALLLKLLEIFRDSFAGTNAWFPESALCYAKALRRGASQAAALQAARAQFSSASGAARGEGDEPYLKLLTRGSVEPLDRDFADLAERVFFPLLDAVQES